MLDRCVRLLSIENEGTRVECFNKSFVNSIFSNIHCQLYQVPDRIVSTSFHIIVICSSKLLDRYS